MAIKEKHIRVNDQIRVAKVRLIDPEGEQVGIVDTGKALQMAKQMELDLVEVAPNAKPPVCKIMDYGKYRYQLSKKEKDMKKKQQSGGIKEIRLRPKIEDHDFNFKIKHIRKFLESGNKVKATIVFRGREMVHQEFGMQVFERMMEALSDIAKVDRKPQLEGRNLVTFLVKK